MRRLIMVMALALLPALPIVAVLVSRSVAAPVPVAAVRPAAAIAAAAPHAEHGMRLGVAGRNILMFFVAGTLITFTLRRGYQRVATTSLPAVDSIHSR